MSSAATGAASNDYTVLIVLNTTTHAVVAMDRSNRVDYAIQCDRLRALSDRWQPRQIIAEQNSIEGFRVAFEISGGAQIYRRDEREHVVKERDHLQDALQCLVAGICRMHTKKVKRDVRYERRDGDRSWMAS
jgi:hypothetical protein